jgi:CheY-like chemotaxis protein
MSFRSYLVLMVLAGLVSLCAVVVGSDYIGDYQRAELAKVEQRLVPKLELGHRGKTALVRLSRAYQDAVASQEASTLELADEQRVALLRLIDEARPALTPEAAERLRREVSDYTDLAGSVTRMMLRGEGNEDSLALMEEMQHRYKRLERSFEAITGLDRNELTHAFGAARTISFQATQFRRGAGVLGAGLLLAFGYFISRQILRRVSVLQAGFSRFARGDFTELIPSGGADELGDVARHANVMVESLERSEQSRAAQDWIRNRQLDLGAILGGNLTPKVTAERSLTFLVEALEALAGTLYLVDEHGELRLAKSTGTSGAKLLREVAAPDAVDPTEGLLGQAFARREITTWEGVPNGYFELRSSLGQTSASNLAFVPLWLGERPIGIAEFALNSPLSERTRGFLRGVMDTLAVSFEAATARAAASELLRETQDQARRLGRQEEELRTNNQELTEQREELRRANEELEEQRETMRGRNRELDRARARTQEKADELARMSRYKSQFLANMSHELRTPLNSMLLLSRLLADNEGQNLSKKQVEYCNTIHLAGRDLLELINQVLDLSKIEAGKTEIDLRVVELDELCSGLERIFRPLAEQQGLEFTVRYSKDISALWTDHARLDRILKNLLGNAIKFTEHGSVELDVSQASGPEVPAHLARSEVVAFRVKDTGIGIARDEQDRVFVPFEQIDSTTARRFQGTGLGLTIARESAIALGGDLVLESEPGRGSTFTVFLPIGGIPAESPSSSEPRAHASSAPIEEGPAQLLIIEDDVMLSEQLTEIVESMSLKAAFARTGEEGLRLAARLRPSGIVLDIKLPDMDGWTVMERLRGTPETAAIPVHFLSALDAPEGALRRGAVGYLTKPATREQLREVVRCLAPNTSRKGSVLVIEDSLVEGTSIVALLEAEHYRASHVMSAEAALLALKGEHFDCLLLDLGLPEMDGLGFLETIRALPEFESTRVIVHTGRSLSKQESRELGVYAQAIVLKDGDSSTRLLEEIRLFAHHISESVPPPSPEPIAPVRSIEGLRILLVEDDMRTVYSLSALLQSKGCPVVVAENGREALARLEEDSSIQCVLMDIMMPVMDGYEAIGKIRENPRWATLPVIAITAKAMLGERERCLAAGATDYLSKPVDGAQLIAKLSLVSSTEEASA